MRVALLFRAIALGAALSGLLVPGLASADVNDKTRARDAYDRGTAAHQRGDFATAAAEYAAADEIAPSPVALQAALDEAIKADVPGLGMELIERSKRGPTTTTLDASVAKARTAFLHRAGQLRAVCKEGPVDDGASCLATLDGKPLQIGKLTWASAGQHTIVIQIATDTHQRLVDLKPDTQQDVAPPAPAPTPTPTPAPAPAPTPAPTPTPTPPLSPTPTPASESGLSPTFVWIGMGATVVLGGVTIASAIRTGDIHSTFTNDGCAKVAAGGCAETAQKGKDLQGLTNLLGGATAVAGVTTAVIALAFTRWSRTPGKEAPETAPRVSVDVTPHGGSAAFAMDF